jgi:hypothetical protein
VRHRWLIALVAAVVLGQAAPAQAAGLDDPAAQWLPRSDGASWTYQWLNSTYSAPRTEHYTVTARAGTGFRVSWEEFGLRADEFPATGFADFRHTDAGLVNTNFQSTPVPPQFPVLCATATRCGNSLAGTYFLMLWGTRSPVLAEPLVKDTRWNSVGGTTNDVTAGNRYLGVEKVTVPAFPAGVMAAKVQSVTTQAGALGDPFGSGVRTIWWVYGVGPVKIVFQHTSGETSFSQLMSTTLAPMAAPSDANLLPLDLGTTANFRWRNDKHMKRWSEQVVRVAAVANNTARVNIRDTRGPIDVNGSYVFSSRLGGLTNVTTVLRRATTSAKLPALGPAKGPEGRARFVTVYDLMTYGFNPIFPAYATDGETWKSSRDSRDFAVYGVSGESRVLGTRTVRVPAGKFKALAIRSKLRQPSHAFGSGSRTMYFAPGVGLVKLTFRHADGSTSTVERVS